MKKLNFVSSAIQRWAFKSNIRVYVTGVGGTTCEWDSLRSSFYEHLKPAIQRVYDVSEADLIALHGPLTDIVLERLKELVKTCHLPIVGVGSELDIDQEGYLLTSSQEKTELKLRLHLSLNYPAPENLHLLASKAVQNV